MGLSPKPHQEEYHTVHSKPHIKEDSKKGGPENRGGKKGVELNIYIFDISLPFVYATKKNGRPEQR